ncbi:adenylate/guanylate cyclase domain-containing protein [Desulfosarcina sp.]|jgi:class 3 adenylate cyclase|uniref:adenylate/guanylate cyclase domain-containing protein n=1 Tax=Desulfosarcina sp. TaxID=2027861 RepID=UPI0039707062
MDTLPTSQLTILFADIAGSTRLYDTFGDFKARELISSCLSQLKELVLENEGTVIKTIGDEVMCTFLTPNHAAETARQMNEEISFDPAMVQANIHLRIGFHHGEVICEPTDVFGEAVNVAARMVALAKSDQIITNRETLSLMKLPLRRRARIVDRTRVRGKDDIMEIHELIWGKPEQMTMSTSFTEEIIAALASEKDFLQIRYLKQRILVDHERPILTMGRGIANHLVINDPLVSRMHARIELQRNRFMLIDQSTNGTFLRELGQDPILLRRDAFQLEGEGLIGLGQKVGQDSPLAVRYRIL